MSFTKKLITATLLLTVLASSSFAKPKAKKTKETKNTNTIKIVTTIFPEYDWTREIIGTQSENTELALLMNNGTDLHSYQPSIQDIAKISTADIFIYVGGESDGWVKDALKNVRNKNIITLNLMELLGDKVREEEIIEGMQAEEEEHHHEHHHDEEAEHDEHGHDEEAESHEEHGHDGEGHHHEDEDEIEYDEHVWLSLRNAKICCNAICEALCKIAPENATAYKANHAAYSKKLDDLDSRISKTVSASAQKTLLFGDRFPFRYFVDDYSLNYYAAFVGCSAETEASFETIIFLAKKVDELGLNSVCQIESGTGKIARTIIQSSKNKNASILTFDSMQSVNNTDIQNGTTYLSIMENNLAILKEALR
jgi:zinc transport system substrate-binding protein